MAKFAVLTPAPRAHLLRYHGILGPAAKWRPLIIPTEDPDSSETPLNAPTSPPPSTGPTAPVMDAEPAPQPPRKRNYTWAELMARVFLVDVLQCERCGGRMTILSTTHPPDAIRKILQCLGLPSRAPPLAPAVSHLTAQMDSF